MADGQGDRLRADTQGTPRWTLANDAQDLAAFAGGAALTSNAADTALAGGAAGAGEAATGSAPTGSLSTLVSDGTQDYGYLSPGSGQAPLAGYTQSSGTTAYLVTDLGGSVRLATSGADSVVGAASYDAWGTAKPTTPDATGQTLLAALQGATPFGYSGQLYDAMSGTYDLRAREYAPSQGQFLTVDPLLAQTQQAYLYATDNPVDNGDPSGQNWVQVAGAQDNASEERIRQTIIDAFVSGDAPGLSRKDVVAANTSGLSGVGVGMADIVSLSPTPHDGRFSGEMYDLVPDSCQPTPLYCTSPSSSLAQQMDWLAAIARRQGLPAQASRGAMGTSQHCIYPTAQRLPVDLSYGRSYPTHYSFATATTQPYYSASYTQFQVTTPSGQYLTSAHLLRPGFIGFSICRWTSAAGVPCHPATKKVETEPVQAVIVRPRSDLLALDLSDHSTITVQPDHVFWVDRDPALKAPGWLTARRMQRGDALRTASGRDVTVVRLRWHVGRAVVYTLTVAHLHTFFVGAARVLVHNSESSQCVITNRPEGSVWNQRPDIRGVTIEQDFLGRAASFDGKYSQNYPVIDDFVRETGVATSIKSLDLTDPTYQQAWRVSDVLKTYAKKLSRFDGANWDGIVIQPSEIKHRVLAVAFEEGVASPQQAAAIDRFRQWVVDKELKIEVVIKYIQ